MENEKNKKTTSIARKINWKIWLHSLKHLIIMDIAILVASFFVFIYTCLEASELNVYDVVNKVTNYEQEVNAIRINRDDSGNFYNSAYLYVNVTFNDDRGTKEYRYYIRDFYNPFRLMACVCLVAELIYIFQMTLNTRRIRKSLRPFNELAIKAEALANGTNVDSLEHLEKVLMQADESVTSIKTGDKDLESLEIALNSLITKIQEAKKSQVRFVSDASHELRTPIAVIQGYVNMLDRWGKDDPEILNEAVEALKNESEHMKELIEQLLFLARGDSGRNSLNRRDFFFEEMLHDLWEESLMIDEKHQYKLDNCEAIEEVLARADGLSDEARDRLYETHFHKYNGDYGMLKQAARIFLSNAAKYSGEGSTIRLSYYENAETAFKGFLIQDEGIGMKASEVGHIFERFYRTDGVRNSETGGTGLGLSIAKWIVDAHEGRIDVLSREEFGTRFMISFP